MVSPLSSGGKRDRPIANPRDTQPVRTDSKSIKPSSHEKVGLWEAKSTLSPLHMKTWDCERHNQHTKELISIKKMSINHNKDMTHLWQLSSGMRVNTRYINSTRGTAYHRQPRSSLLSLCDSFTVINSFVC